MNILNGIKNFLTFVNDNWTTIAVIIGLGIAVYKKIRAFLKKTNDEKFEIAKAQIKEICLKLITDAEVDYDSWNKAGSIKRSQVIDLIFTKFPILNKVTNQETVIAFIDDTINESLKTLRDIMKDNTPTE